MVPTKIITFSCVLILFIQFTCINSLSKDHTLRFVALLFRHGDRANDASTIYPKDPYQNETYYPYGLGQLTNKGKRTEYSLGKKLRKRYNAFLGNLYTPDVLRAVSTEMDRTKMSLQLVLAGLYPPSSTLLEWNKNLNWQPIPYNYLLFTEDHLMSFPLAYCANYAPIYAEYLNSAEGQEIEKPYVDYYPYVSQHTGINVTSLLDLFGLYFGLTTQKEYGLVLPEWTDKVYPEYMYNAASNFYVLSSGSTKLKQLSGGFLLKKIINDIGLKLENQLLSHNQKLMIYSGHEINLAYLLRAMELFHPHVPPYGACIMIEVHTINKTDGIKVYYENYSGDGPQLLTVPGCDSFCPFQKFVELLQKNLPSGDNDCGTGSTVIHNIEDIRKQYLNL